MGLTYRAAVWPAQPEMTQTGHHETPRDARQIGRQVVGGAVCKVFLLGVAAKAGGGQHDNRQARRQQYTNAGECQFAGSPRVSTRPISKRQKRCSPSSSDRQSRGEGALNTWTAGLTTASGNQEARNPDTSGIGQTRSHRVIRSIAGSMHSRVPRVDDLAVHQVCVESCNTRQNLAY